MTLIESRQPPTEREVEMACQVDDGDGPCGAVARYTSTGTCDKHYQRARKGTSGPPRFRFPESLLSRMEPRPNGCIYYAGSISPTGYGSMTVNGERRPAHVVSYEFFVGPISDGAVIDHLCHNDDLACEGGDSCPHRRCVNWKHLEPTTRSENSKRGRPGDKRGPDPDKAHCPQGHPYDEANTYVVEGTTWRKCRTCDRERHATRRAVR